MSWDDLPSLTNDLALGPLAGLEIDDEKAIVKMYQQLANALCDDPPSLAFAMESADMPGGGAGYVRTLHRIDLDPREGIDEPADIDTGRWRGYLHAQFWHEFGHSQYSRQLFEPSLAVEIDAQQPLEDIRAERLLVRDYPQSRPWLRANILARRSTAKWFIQLPEEDWLYEYFLSCARSYANVLTGEEAADIRERAPARYAQKFADLDEIVGAYAALDDPASLEAAKLIKALAQHLPGPCLP